MDLTNIDTFICIGAHCDDIEWAVGGLFARLVRQGARGVYVVAVENPYVGEGVDMPDAATAYATRQAESREGAKRLGASRVEFFGFKSYYLTTPDRKMIVPAYRSADETRDMADRIHYYGRPPIANAYLFPECVSALRDMIEQEQPDLIVTHPCSDCHPDHYGVSRFVQLVVEDLNREGASIPILYHEPGRLLGTWRPTLLVELSEDDLAVKARAYDCFPSQHPQGTGTLMRDLAERMGRLGGVPLAEGFVPGGSMMDADWMAGEEAFDAVIHAASAPTEVVRLHVGEP